MTELETKLTAIKTEKDTKIIPGNIKTGVTILGVTGTYDGSAPYVEEKDVNFYDYDGTRVYSYTKAQFLALSSLPANPTHTGLTSQGWNWTLSDAKAYATNCTKLDIGQLYITDNGKTRIYIKITEETLSPYICFAVDGTATIEWGDGNSDTVTGSDTTTLISTQHIYSAPGDYVISLSSEDDIYLYGNMANRNYFVTELITKDTTSTGVAAFGNSIYFNNVYKIELSDNIVVGTASFANMNGLQILTIPSTIDLSGSFVFDRCASLKCLVLPTGTTGIGLKQLYSLKTLCVPNSFTGGINLTDCYSLTELTLPNTLVNVILSTCYALTYIRIPNSITSIPASAYMNCYGMQVYDFTQFSSVPTLANKNAFNGMATECKIVVPDALYNDWVADSVWSNVSSNIISESDFNA